VRHRAQGQSRQRPFALRVEETFGREPLLEHLEGLLKRSDAPRLDLIKHELESASRRVEVEAAVP